MKKYLLLFASILTVGGVGIILSSCESDDPPPNPTVNFARATRTLSESAGTLEVEVTLDRASDKDIIIGYDIDGSAEEGSDYDIPVDIGEVEIPAGSTTGVFEIVITNDTFFEGNETIELRIDDAPSDVQIGEDDEMVITITEDDAQPVVSFTETTFTVNEDDGGIDLEISLSAASGQDVTVNYSIDGNAWDSVYAFEQEIPEFYYDYFIDGESGTVTIPAGETTGVIAIRIYTDFWWELPESMEFTLTGATGATLTTVVAKKKATGTLTQQDGRGIELSWGNTDANLNLFLWAGTSLANLQTINSNTTILGFSTWPQEPGDDVDEAFEAVFLPTIMGELAPTLDAFAVSVLYKTGTVTPLEFELLHFDFADGTVEDEANMDINIGTYTLANLNNFPTSSNVYPKNIQTFERVGGQYTVPTGITEPVSGSRVDTEGSKYPLKITDPSRVRLLSRAERQKLQMRISRGDFNVQSVRK